MAQKRAKPVPKPKPTAKPAAGTGGKAASAPPPPAAAAPGPDLARVLAYVGLGIAFWASMPQWSGPKLNVEASKEVADHIVPAIVVVFASLVGIWASRRPQGPGAFRFMAAMAVLLAGLWMMATHIPLLLEATRDEAPWPATIYHNSSAFAVFGLGLLWATVTWSEAGDESEPATAKAEK